MKGPMDDGVSVSELLQVMKERGAGYAFLSRAYAREVSADLLDQIVSEFATGEADGESEGRASLQRFAESASGVDRQQLETDLAAEYASLFLNAGRQPVFPYESVYTSAERLLMQRARDEVRAEYRREGLGKPDGLHEPEDHIAIELEFMARLCQKAATALERGDRAGALASLKKQQAFLAQHLLVWVPRFCQDVEWAAQSDFYRGIAQLTAGFLAEEQETIPSLEAAISE